MMRERGQGRRGRIRGVADRYPRASEALHSARTEGTSHQSWIGVMPDWNHSTGLQRHTRGRLETAVSWRACSYTTTWDSPLRRIRGLGLRRSRRPSPSGSTSRSNPAPPADSEEPRQPRPRLRRPSRCVHGACEALPRRAAGCRWAAVHRRTTARSCWIGPDGNVRSSSPHSRQAGSRRSRSPPCCASSPSGGRCSAVRTGSVTSFSPGRHGWRRSSRCPGRGCRRWTSQGWRRT